MHFDLIHKSNSSYSIFCEEYIFGVNIKVSTQAKEDSFGKLSRLNNLFDVSLLPPATTHFTIFEMQLVGFDRGETTPYDIPT